MRRQPDYVSLAKKFDDAYLELFRAWATLLAEYIDGVNVGPRKWDIEFLRHIADRLPELKKSRDYRRLAQRLNRLASRVPTMTELRAWRARQH